MSKTGEKMVRTALDDLPYGNNDPEMLCGKVVRPPLPEGITKKMLIKDVLLIAWPCLLELILSQLTSMADQVMVGRLPGQEGIMALSAVGLAAQPKFLLMTMIQAMNVGSTAVIARFRGQQNKEKTNQVFIQALMLNLFMSVLFMVLGLAFARPLITFMGGSGISNATLDLAVTYFNIQLYGFVPLALSFTMTAALRGIGDTKMPMIYNTTANVVNIIFNYIMIYGKFGCPSMGVAGASWATIIGQFIAFTMAVFTVTGNRRYISIDLKNKITFDKKIMADVAGIGLPSMIEQLFLRAGIMIFSRTVAGLGDTAFATHQICMNLQSMSFMLGQAFGNSATTLMGQSIGKRRHDMSALYMEQTRIAGVCVSLVVCTLFIVFRRLIVGLYNSTPEVINSGSQILILIAASQPIQTDQFVVSGGLRGAGDTRYTAFVVAVCVLGLRAGLGLLTINVFHWGLWGAWISLIADQMVRTVFMAARYSGGKWKTLRLQNEIKANS